MVYETKDWTAWLNRMPPDNSTLNPTLHVRGTVKVPNARYDAELVKSGDVEWGSTLVLKVQTAANADVGATIPTPREVAYEESGPHLNRFEKVKILLPDDESSEEVEIKKVD